MTLTELATRLEQATGPILQADDDPVWDLIKAPFPLNPTASPRNRDQARALFVSALRDSSLDAAVALCEKVLPTLTWQIETGDPSIEASPSATVSPRCGDCPPWLDWQAEGATPAVALCLAVVRALIAKKAT